jgi:hypothetical protein
MLIVQSQSQALNVLKHFILDFQEENQRVTRIVINDEKNVPLASHDLTFYATSIARKKTTKLGTSKKTVQMRNQLEKHL